MTQRFSTSKPPLRSSRNSSDPNVFSDDYALEEYEPVVDGRPPASGYSGPAAPPMTSTPSTTPPPRRSQSLQAASESPYEAMRRSRLSQRSTGRNSTISNVDDRASRQSVSDLGRTLSTQHRSFRTLSSLGTPRPQSPYRGPTGPSQPYGMFTQDVSLARSPSTATTSTIRPPERAYSGPVGPTQPYGMFSQNTVPEDDPATVGMAPPLPAFAGIPPASQSQAVRQLGPDGEGADDILGPDGYAEQLPPYSRYANGIPPKVDPAAANIPPHLNPNPHLPLQIPQPEMAQDGPSEYYRPEPREVPSVSPITANPFDDSSATLAASSPLPSPSVPSSEKPSFKDRVKRRGNRRVCCGLLPCWALIFVVVVVFAAIMLGGIVGGLVAHHTYSRHPHYTEAPQPANVPVTITTTTLADASPIATPTNLPLLPTGTFSYILDNPVSGQNLNSCLPVEQQVAWDCSTGAKLNVSISMPAPHTPQLSIGYTLPSDPQMPDPPNPQIRYGAQPPVSSGPVNMNLMRDKKEWNNGPAYFFQQSFNKTVILKTSDLPGGYHKAKRSEPDVSSHVERRQSDWVLDEFVMIADKPWYCFWNGTLLEGFIYVTQNEGSPEASNAAAASSFASATAAATSAAPYGSTKKRRQAGLTTNSNTYPKEIKIEERRPLRNPPAPYCQQMQIMNNGQPAPFEPEGQPIIFNLTENEPLPLAQAAYLPPPPPPTSYKGKRNGQNSNCMCEWQN